MDPVLARDLLARLDRIEVHKPKRMLLPFFRETPPMSPNLERYGVTIMHNTGASQTDPIDYLGTHYNLVEAVRPKIDKYSKPIVKVYLRLTYEEAQAIPEQLEIGREVYRLSHFYSFKCPAYGV